MLVLLLPSSTRIARLLRFIWKRVVVGGLFRNAAFFIWFFLYDRRAFFRFGKRFFSSRLTVSRDFFFQRFK